MASRIKTPEYREGTEAAWRFEHGVSRVLSVTKDELEKREAAYQESRKNKSRPGPKQSIKEK